MVGEALWEALAVVVAFRCGGAETVMCARGGGRRARTGRQMVRSLWRFLLQRASLYYPAELWGRQASQYSVKRGVGVPVLGVEVALHAIERASKCGSVVSQLVGVEQLVDCISVLVRRFALSTGGALKRHDFTVVVHVGDLACCGVLHGGRNGRCGRVVHHVPQLVRDAVEF